MTPNQMCRAANNRSTTPTEPPRIRSTLPNQPTESPRRQTSQPIFHESAPRRRTQPTESPRRQISQPIRQESSSRHQISQPSLHEQCQQSDPIQQRASAVLCGFDSNMGLLVILTMLTLFAVGEMLPVVPWAVRNETDMVDSSTEQTFQELNVVISNRGYAYMTALVVMMLFGAFVYCHTASIRKQRILEQLNERDLLPEWSPLLITSKNIRPPTPYEQVV